jgi:DNA-binding CsgD family transcriptional regulator
LRRPRSAVDEQEAETRLKALELGWASRNAAFSQFFSALHAPDAPEHYSSLSDLLRATTTAANAIRIIRAYWQLDLVDSLQQVRCPTLILHSRDDPIVPFEEGRLAASLVPGARFVPIDSRNHILVESEAGWRQLVSEVDEFLPAPLATANLSVLTMREREVLNAVARGHGNQAIAKQLGIAEKTVRNHVSTIFDKLGVESRSEAIVIARERGFGR